MTEPPLKPSTPELLERFRQALAARQYDQAERCGEILSVREPGDEEVIGFLVARAIATLGDFHHRHGAEDITEDITHETN